jgi:hypothetical protein
MCSQVGGKEYESHRFLFLLGNGKRWPKAYVIININGEVLHGNEIGNNLCMYLSIAVNVAV